MKFKLVVLVHLHYEETLMKKKKKELPTCIKDLDNLTYGLFKKPGRYTHCRCGSGPIFHGSFYGSLFRFIWCFEVYFVKISLVICHHVIGCCKRPILQMDRMVGALSLYMYIALSLTPSLSPKIHLSPFTH
jgi:hypothetical protein